MSSDIQTLASQPQVVRGITGLSPTAARMRSTASSASPELPTEPCSVVWSRGHAYVLENGYGRARWAGVDDRGRPVLLTSDELRRRGWSERRD